jgi:hypothetical protein
MVGAPRIVYSAVVKNQTNHDLTLKASYEMPKQQGGEHFEVLLPANGLAVIPQRLVQDETCTLTGHIISITVVGGGSLLSEAKGPFNVSHPTKDHPFLVSETETGILIREGTGSS